MSYIFFNPKIKKVNALREKSMRALMTNWDIYLSGLNKLEIANRRKQKALESLVWFMPMVDIGRSSSSCTEAANQSMHKALLAGSVCMLINAKPSKTIATEAFGFKL